MKCSETIQNYFNDIEKNVEKAYKKASDARSLGFDPDKNIEITLAKNMAERVIGLISVIAPQIKKSGAVERIIELETEFGVLDWRVALVIALEIAQEKFCKFQDKKEAIEVGIRTGFAYATVGVVSSPLEGFMGLDIKKTKLGKEYFCMNFAGPIRNAGGTAASVSVIIGDYVRVKLGYHPYDPDEREIKRTFTEISDYHERVTNLQYFPSEEESEFMTSNVPIEIGGDPSEKFDVSNYKDLPRVPTNKIRSGFCLIHSSCLPLKGPKLWKQLSKWGKDFSLDHWKFLETFLKIQKASKAKTSKTDEVPTEKPRINPDFTYITDLVAGRPVLGHPLEKGGFRLRLGRSRTSGYSGQSIHPATMHVLKGYIATGTQLKVERPGKGAAFTPCDTIQGPIVKLKDGSVLILNSEKLARQHKKNIEEIIFLGDVLVNYGDFFNRAHSLIPVGYCEEWWIQELEKATVSMFGSLDIVKLSHETEVSDETLKQLFHNPMKSKLTGEDALKIAKITNTPLHPYYTYHWKDVSLDGFWSLIDWMKKSKIEQVNNQIEKIIARIEPEPKRVLELLGVPHLVVNNEYAVIEKNAAFILVNILRGFALEKENSVSDVLELINKISPVFQRDKSGCYIGSRMGRPEKAKMRKLKGNPHILFPVSDQGGRLRSFQSALELGFIEGDFPLRYCSWCKQETFLFMCEICGKDTEKTYYCRACGNMKTEHCSQHGKNQTYSKRRISIKKYIDRVLKDLDLRALPDIVKGVRGTSNEDHIPENLAKGILRAKHNLYVNKDGTIRIDASEITCTHCKPKEIGTSVETLKKLGYNLDCYGKILEDENQILELKPQDVILPACTEALEEPSDIVLFRITKFIDELLVKLYKQPAYYDLNNKKDLVGHYIIGLAPHTSAGMVGRIIGFSKTQCFLAHPNYHAANRRDCDGDELGFMLLLDGFLNFSRKYLPSSRGGTMDAPLVLTSLLNPAEVDDMAFDVDIVWKYPLELYEASSEYKMPWDIKIRQIKDVLGSDEQYEGMGFTHDTDSFNSGIQCSAYKILPSMEEKLKGQMELAEMIRAVDTSDVARLVIEKHFIRDTKGNLRKFSQQSFRCVKCNCIFRRPPLVGKCTACGGKIMFTISEGSIIKYLEPSISLAKKYNVPIYLQQSLELLKRRVEDVFGKEKEKQTGLGAWFG